MRNRIGKGLELGIAISQLRCPFMDSLFQQSNEFALLSICLLERFHLSPIAQVTRNLQKPRHFTMRIPQRCDCHAGPEPRTTLSDSPSLLGKSSVLGSHCEGAFRPMFFDPVRRVK